MISCCLILVIFSSNPVQLNIHNLFETLISTENWFTKQNNEIKLTILLFSQKQDYLFSLFE